MILINIDRKRIILVIFLCIFIAAVFSGYCFAKYEIEKNIKSSSKVATPVLEVKGKETTKISAINTVGYYDFIVKNYNESKISDVPQNYYIEINSNCDNSISFELYKGDEIINLSNNRTSDIFIPNIQQIEHSYRLKVTYNKLNNNLGNDILEDIQLIVHSEQSIN